MDYTPIAIFAYNRPHYLEQTLKSLNTNMELRFSDVYIFCDGPRNINDEEELNLLSHVREIAKNFKGSNSIVVYENEINKGLGKSIVEGVSNLLARFDSIIVLEDDLEVSPFFLDYMNKSLEKYKEEKSVLSISGYTYPFKELSNYDFDTYLLKSADCLGWGTWSDRWNLYKSDANYYLNRIRNIDISEFNFDNNYDFYSLLQKTSIGKSNSWAIKWYATAFIHDMLSLYPTKSLVRHIGNLGENIKADNSDFLGWEINEQMKVNCSDIDIIENFDLRKGLVNHFYKYKRTRITISSIKYAYRRLIIYNLKRYLKL